MAIQRDIGRGGRITLTLHVLPVGRLAIDIDPDGRGGVRRLGWVGQVGQRVGGLELAGGELPAAAQAALLRAAGTLDADDLEPVVVWLLGLSESPDADGDAVLDVRAFAAVVRAERGEPRVEQVLRSVGHLTADMLADWLADTASGGQYARAEDIALGRRLPGGRRSLMRPTSRQAALRMCDEFGFVAPAEWVREYEESVRRLEAEATAAEQADR